MSFDGYSSLIGFVVGIFFMVIVDKLPGGKKE